MESKSDLDAIRTENSKNIEIKSRQQISTSMRRRSSFPPNQQLKTFAQSRFNDVPVERNIIKRLDSENEYHVRTQGKLAQRLSGDSNNRETGKANDVTRLPSKASSQSRGLLKFPRQVSKKIFPKTSIQSSVSSSAWELHKFAAEMIFWKLRENGQINIQSFRHKDHAGSCCMPDTSLIQLSGSVELVASQSSSTQHLFVDDNPSFAASNIAFPVADDGSQSIMSVLKTTIVKKNPLIWIARLCNGPRIYTTVYKLSLSIKSHNIPVEALLAAEFTLKYTEALPVKVVEALVGAAVTPAGSHFHKIETFEVITYSQLGKHKHFLGEFTKTYRLDESGSIETVVHVSNTKLEHKFDLCNQVTSDCTFVKDTAGNSVAVLRDEGDPEFNFSSLGHKSKKLRLSAFGLRQLTHEDCLLVYYAAVFLTCHS